LLFESLTDAKLFAQGLVVRHKREVLSLYKMSKKCSGPQPSLCES